MAGTSPAMTLWQRRGHVSLGDRVVEILPFRIVLKDQSDFPLSWPMLDVVLALDRGLDFFVALEIDEQLDAVLLRETGHEPFAMLVDSSHEIIRHTDVQNSIGRACQDVHPPA